MFCVPEGSDVVSTVNCVRVAFTVMLSGADAVAGGDCESATCSVNGYVPTVVGVPEITQFGGTPTRFNPGGKLPEVTLQV